MDLDGFEAADVSARTAIELPVGPAAETVLRHIDANWYIQTSRRGRWMDLMGDYAGSEMFVLDGEALLQQVLNDPLLALGRNCEPSFQALHATYSLERLLNEFKRRSATFEVVFWHDNRHLTCNTAQDAYVNISRGLARSILFKHLQTLDITLHTFKSLQDPEWLTYRRLAKPMFVMTNDGGVLNPDDDLSEALLLQRVFIFDVLAQGTSVALLQGAEYRESKIMTFVYEQRHDPRARGRFQKKVWAAVATAAKALEAREIRARHGLPVLPLATFAPQHQQVPATDEACLVQILQKTISALGIHAKAMKEILFAFLGHLVIVPTLTLEQRAQKLAALHPQLSEMLVNSFLPSAFLAVESAMVSAKPEVDGHIFVALLSFALEHADMSFAELFGDAVCQQLDALWASTKFGRCDFATLAARFPSPLAVKLSANAVNSLPVRMLLPFSNPVFDEHLAQVHVDVGEEDPPDVVTHLDFDTVFNDVYHWHNHKRTILPAHLGGQTYQPLDARQRFRMLRNSQRFMSSMERQAQTLTGAFGIPLQRMIIPSVGSQVQRPASRAIQAKVAMPQPKKGKKEHVSSADKIRLANIEKQQTKVDDSNVPWWKDQLNTVASMPISQQITHIENIQRNKRTREGWLAVEVRLFRLHLEFVHWIEDDERESKSVQDQVTVAILKMIKDTYQMPNLFPLAVDILDMCLLVIGLSALTTDMKASSPTPLGAQRSLAFKFVKLIKSKSKSVVHKFMHIREDPIIWQLRLFGEFMDRSMDSEYDRRVHFKPDAWQRKVLDCLDDTNHSVLVVAPTSAGKTFISYYAMEQVLRQSDDGILVYVAPTKALVNQIAAEVYARYDKKLRGRSCWAIHTRDYRIHDPQKCQILVTVPEMLAIMLLSPSLARVWTPRIKRVILDEIHCIGQQEGGAVWEQILLFAPCPIIGLSATIGHPEEFNDWLGSVQTAHQFKHTFIHHPHRYSHLRKFAYLLKGEAPDTFRGIASHRTTGRMRFLHPVSMLGFGVHELPPDFALEAADCLSLYEALSVHLSPDYADLHALEPVRFFTVNHDSNRLLKQKDILRYESRLKMILNELLASEDRHGDQSTLNSVVETLDDRMVHNTNHYEIPDRDKFQKNLIYLLSDLHATGDLPAIMFNFERLTCEKMCQKLLADLTTAETKWKRSSPEWQRKLARWELWKSQAALRARQTEKLARRKNPDGMENDTTQSESMSWESSFNPNDPLPQFSFGDKTSAYSKADLEQAISELRRWTSVPQWALEALRRGVGVHHSGMNKRYRSTLEGLFRLGVVRVVIATGTLALGINAPAKTSVFCGDSPFLTALMFRQCAGRAGRRGFDLLGKVVFYGLSIDRCQRLVLSRLPSLGGNFPLTATMTLRLFNLLSGSEYAPFAVRAATSILRLPHVGYKSDVGSEQVAHFMRFSIDYLRRAGLLDPQGNPINLFGIASHLYYTEPSNLALVALFRHGVIHRICCQSDQFTAKREFLVLLCHLFGRRYLPNVYATDSNLQQLVKKSPSMVLLPPLPADARRVLSSHDVDILSIFTNYTVAYTTQYRATLGPDTKLPMSGSDHGSGVQSPITSPFVTKLDHSAVRPADRSLFVANSGHSDHYQTVEELCWTSRDGLHLNQFAIPSMRVFTSSSSDRHHDCYKLNAYILDFYIHGQRAALQVANGIRDNDLWYLLDDFTLTLKSIRAGLGQLLLESSNRDTTGEKVDEDVLEGMDVDLEAKNNVDGEETVGGVDEGDDDDDDIDSGLTRPLGVSDEDWAVFKLIDAVTTEFEAKFRAIWA